MQVVQGVYAGVTTKELDELAAQTAAYCSTLHPQVCVRARERAMFPTPLMPPLPRARAQYAVLAGRIAVTRLHKETIPSFSENARLLASHVHAKTGLPSPLIAEDVLAIILANAEVRVTPLPPCARAYGLCGGGPRARGGGAHDSAWTPRSTTRGT